MENDRMVKVKWIFLSALVWLGCSKTSNKEFREILQRPDYADLLRNKDYPALFKKREILAMSDELRWYTIGVAPIVVVFLLVQLMSLVIFLLWLWN